MITNELIAGWQSGGVNQGDTLLLHSNITSIVKKYLRKKIKLNVEILLDSFLKALGPDGTLLLPLFNFDFTKGVPFDYHKTPSQMGALTEAGRLHPLAVRTGHPIYSFAVIGAKAELFTNINNFSGYGSDSPFALLHQLDGKIGVLNLPDQHSMTYYHYVEEMLEVDYRYHKVFSGDYCDKSGRTEKRSYGLFVRNIEKGVLTHVNPAGELMWKEDLYKGFRPDEGCGLRTVSARAMYDFTEKLIQSGKAKGLLYKLEGESDD